MTQSPPTEKKTSAPIIQHMEHYLGPISDGWDSTAGGEHLAFPLARFTSTPRSGWCVLSTLGLSAHVMKQSNQEGLRQELLTCWPETVMDDAIPSHLYALANHLHANGEALGRGAVLPMPETPLLPSGGEKPWAAWFVDLPYFLPEAAIICQETDPITLLAWLMPVYAEEADFILSEGPEAFEARILEKGAEFFTWPRPSLV